MLDIVEQATGGAIPAVKGRHGPVRTRPRRRKLRVLVASHGHPRFAKGGGEIAAYALFDALRASGECDVWFLGCQRHRDGFTSPITQPFGDNEFVYASSGADWFGFANRDPLFPAQLERLITELQPDIVHFHHYANFGIEAFHIAKRARPAAKLVLTLHEYWAICANQGQMVKVGSGYLCDRASIADCQRCFPERDRSEFVVREWYLKTGLSAVDQFIAPSRFLSERYVEWGLPADKISVVENVVGSREADAPRAETASRSAAIGQHKLLRVGFFGQLSASKGIDVLLKAARLLETLDRESVSFSIHGDDRNQTAETQRVIAEALAAAGGNVSYLGPYDESDVDALMREIDLVVVPSIWWENSPVVIQEALRNGRPVVCSNIGGMAEKVRDGIDGFHFPVGDAVALAQLLRRLAREPERLDAVRGTLHTPPAALPAAKQHVALYGTLLAKPSE